MCLWFCTHWYQPSSILFVKHHPHSWCSPLQPLSPRFLPPPRTSRVPPRRVFQMQRCAVYGRASYGRRVQSAGRPRRDVTGCQTRPSTYIGPNRRVFTPAARQTFHFAVTFPASTSSAALSLPNHWWLSVTLIRAFFLNRCTFAVFRNSRIARFRRYFT